MDLQRGERDGGSGGQRSRRPTAVVIGHALGVAADKGHATSDRTCAARAPAIHTPEPKAIRTQVYAPAPSRAPRTTSARVVRRAILPRGGASDNVQNATSAPLEHTSVVPTPSETKGERKRHAENDDSRQLQPLKRRASEEALRAFEARATARFLRLMGASDVPFDGKELVFEHTSIVHRKREAFNRIRDFFQSRLDIGLDTERQVLARYVEAPANPQGLLVHGSSPETTWLLVRALLRSLDLDHFECFFVKGHLASTPLDLYDTIRHALCGNWRLPRWRCVGLTNDPESLPKAYAASMKSILVIENIDPLVKAAGRSQTTLNRLFRYLNGLVQARGLKLLVVGHSAQTIDRFSSFFGGFDLYNHAECVLRLPQYTIQTLSAHLHAVATAALAPMGAAVQLTDVFAKQVIELAVRKAAKAGQCDLDAVVRVLQWAIIRVKNQCLTSTADAHDPTKWLLRYEHVSVVSAKQFQHDYVHRVQCVGTMTQAVLLVLIDAGPCTKEELFQHVYDRHRVHVWILIITTFRREKFEVALELLLSVPIVKTREKRVWRGGEWRSETLYYAPPSREQFIEAAGKKPLLKLILGDKK